MVDAPLDLEPRLNMLGKLPLELFVRVLEELHPVDLLAVARTNRRLHEFLRDEQNECVWRTSRQSHVKFEIPDPVQMSEYAMASLLFDYGECMICGDRDPDRVQVWSHTYGERICGDTSCRVQAGEACPINLSIIFTRLKIQRAESEFIKPSERHADLICSLVRSECFCNPPNHRQFGQCSGEHKEIKDAASYRMCKKTDVEMILADLEAGFTEEQLQEKYKSTNETRDRYSVFVSQLEACSVRVRVERVALLLRTLLGIFIEWYDRESGYANRVKKICRILDVTPEDLSYDWEFDA